MDGSVAECFGCVAEWQSAACPSDLQRRFYDGHDRKADGSTFTQALLLRPWIRCFMAIIPAWRNLTSSQLKKSEAKFKRKTWKQGQILSESGFVLRKAPTSLSRDRRIKMNKKLSICPKTFSLFSACYFLIKKVLCSELVICCYDMYMKDLLSSKVILGYELIAKIKLMSWYSCNEKR